MKWIRCGLALACFALLYAASGCTASFGRTADERAHMYSTVLNSETRMMADDVDVWNMVERRTRLTRWH